MFNLDEIIKLLMFIIIILLLMLCDYKRLHYFTARNNEKIINFIKKIENFKSNPSNKKNPISKGDELLNKIIKNVNITNNNISHDDNYKNIKKNYKIKTGDEIGVDNYKNLDDIHSVSINSKNNIYNNYVNSIKDESYEPKFSSSKTSALNVLEKRIGL